MTQGFRFPATLGFSFGLGDRLGAALGTPLEGRSKTPYNEKTGLIILYLVVLRITS